MSKRMIQMLGVLLAVIAILGFVKFQQIQAAIAAGKTFSMPPETVTTTVAAATEWETALDAVGSVAPMQGVTLSADQPGTVEKILFQSGSRVGEGQVLVRLDARQERAQLASAEARRDLAKSNLDRSEKLLAGDVIAQAEFDQVAALFKQSDAAVKEASAAVERKTIRAPFAGTAGIRQVNLGQYLHSGDPVVPLQSTTRVYVDFTVPQQQVGSLRPGATVHVLADTGIAPLATGKVTAINPVADEATRNVQVQATFGNSTGRLRAGMYARVRVLAGFGQPVVPVPVSAINYAPYGNSVFIVEEIKGPDGKPYKGVRQQFVHLGAARGDQVAVLGGIKPGQEIVTSGVFKLRTGGAVVVNNAIQPSNNPSPKPEDS